ncbi:YfhO family protein, partial [bacterium]|nr:YfhO family protein [bacterium]
PFGNNSYLMMDSNMQFVPFLGYFKSIFTTNTDFVYSFSKAGGNGMFDFNAYYINNPLNFIAFLFPGNRLDFAVQVITIIKMGLAGLCFSIFLNYSSAKFDWKSLIFSTAYALSTCAIYYPITVLGFEVMYLLPLALIGIEKLINERKCLLYILITALTFLLQPYAGWVVLLFSFCYFLYYYSLNLPEKDLRKKVWGIFFLSVVFIIALGAIVTLPTMYALQGTKYKLYFPKNVILFMFQDLLGAFYTGSTLKSLYWVPDTPLIYCGILPFLLFISYFFNKGIERRERLIMGLFVVLLLFMYSWHITFTLFNGGNVYPQGCVFRFLYVFLIIMLLIGYKNLSKFEFHNNLTLLCLTVIYVLATVFVYFYPNEIVNQKIIIFDLFFGLVVISLLFLLNKYQKILLPVLLSLFLLHFSELAYNGVIILDAQSRCRLFTPESYKNKYDELSQVISFIKEKDKGFYRIETEESIIDKSDWFDGRWNNLPMLFNYNAISHYSSLGKIQLRQTLDTLGFDVFPFSNIIEYNDNMTAFPVGFFGIKYIISDKEEHINPYKQLKTFEGYKKLYLYENPFALPIAFISQKDILNKDLLDKDNIFTIWNEIAKTITGQDFGDIYDYRKIENVVYSDYDSFAIMKFRSDFNAPIWLSQSGDSVKKYKYLTLNRKPIRDSNTTTLFNLEFLGNLNQNDEQNLIAYKYINFMPGGRISFFYGVQDADRLKEYFDLIKNKPCNLEMITSSRLRGNFITDEDEQALFMTIPFDENWEIKIDGEKAVPKKVLGSMTGILIKTKGNHTIEMKYNQKGLREGSLISLLSLIFLLLLVGRRKILI